MLLFLVKVTILGVIPIELPEFKSYLNTTLGLQVRPALWADGGKLPFYLRDRYAFYQARINELSCILMADRRPREEQPSTIRKHLRLVGERSGKTVVYVRSQLTSYHRKRLIEQKVPFVVPGNQLYLPMLGIDLREHYRQLTTETKTFSPATQALVIHILHNSLKQLSSVAQLASRLGYSKMTMSRAFDELEAAESGACRVIGRERVLLIKDSPKEFWEKARPRLRTPVKKTIHRRDAKREIVGYRAGLTALAEYTNLAAPPDPVVALSREDGTPPKEGTPETARIPLGEDRDYQVQIWRYPPEFFVHQAVVDRFSLYLSLRDTEDERVLTALDEMMEQVEW